MKKQNPFWRGFRKGLLSPFSVQPSRKNYRRFYAQSPQEAFAKDRKALRGDFEKVARDFNKAVKQFNAENKKP